MLSRDLSDAAGSLCKEKNSRCFDANSPFRFGRSIANANPRIGSPEHRRCGGTRWAFATRADGAARQCPWRPPGLRGDNRKIYMAAQPLQLMKRPHVPNRSAFIGGFLPGLLRAGWLAIAVAAAPWPAHAQDTGLKFGERRGSVSGLPVPRFVSLKADRVNLHEGPSRDHRTTWVFQRAGLPVEVTAEFDIWRKVRDSEGTEGWVLHSLLSGRRTALIAPWKKGEVFSLLAQPAKGASPIARLQSGVIAAIKSCDGSWCHISGNGFDGYIRQTSLWGVYPNEKIE